MHAVVSIRNLKNSGLITLETLVFLCKKIARLWHFRADVVAWWHYQGWRLILSFHTAMLLMFLSPFPIRGCLIQEKEKAKG